MHNMISCLLALVDPEFHKNLIELYEKHNALFIKYARTFLHSRFDENYYYDAEDVVQRAYNRVIKYDKIDFSRSEGELKSYMISTVLNSAKDFLNETKYIESVEEKYDLAGMTDQEFFDRLQISDHYYEVVACIKEMKFEYSTTLLFKLKGMSVNEIAEHMGVPEQTVYSRIHRARVRLFDRIGDTQDYGRQK